METVHRDRRLKTPKDRNESNKGTYSDEGGTSLFAFESAVLRRFPAFTKRRQNAEVRVPLFHMQV
jgi:hypothetical protein